MVRRRVAEAIEAMHGTLASGDPAAVWSGAVLDSRKVSGGELFFALRGEKSDGHLHVAQAFERGAAAAVVHGEAKAPADATLIRVADSYAALHALTRAIRAEVPRRLVGITGSVGKTTTKELLALMLAQRFRVAKSPGNLNNLYGFPVALLGVPEDTEWMVAEMGMSTPGELGAISELARPDVAVFTAVRAVHLEFFGTLEAIAEAKAELLRGLVPGGLIVANADDAQVVRIAKRHAAAHGNRIVWFGLGADALVRAEDVVPTDDGSGTRFTLVAPDVRQPVVLPLLGRHNVENFLAAAACALELGVPASAIARSTGAAAPAAGRGVIHRLANGAVVVDDSYNSNPAAVERALAAAAVIPGRRHWAVLGDMLELGEGGPEMHRACGEIARSLGFAPVVGVGALSRSTVAGAAEAGDWQPDAAHAAPHAAGLLRSGDVVLVKGSRGVGLEVVVQALIAAGAHPDRQGEGRS